MALLAYVFKKTRAPWAQTIRDAIRQFAQNAPYFDVDDFRAFALSEHIHTLETEAFRTEFKESVRSLVAGGMAPEDHDMEIDWE